MSAFRPHPWSIGGHRQTLLGYWSRRRLRWTPPTEDLVAEAGDDVSLLLRVSWQPGPREARPSLVLVHGLGGWDGATYLLATGLLAWSRGWHVARMNMRGAGDALAVCARLYDAGLDSDLLAAVRVLLRHTPRVAVAGFSLGAGLTLLAAGRSGPRLPPGLVAVAGVSPPLDLASCAGALERPDNRLYQWYFVRGLRSAYRERQRRLPNLYEAGRERGIRTVREFDAAVTAPYGGYRDVDDYYARASAGPHLASVARPALLLAAQDDPMIPADSVARWPASPLVRRELLPTGGHVGFVAPSAAPGRFWAAERLVGFLEEFREDGAGPRR
ncbi:MAG: alpha/beta fold hydrolase [Acidobacteria bacterium]|nr:alpha/beta fold hydrolase [Acidobacteriota bacterium]